MSIVQQGIGKKLIMKNIFEKLCEVKDVHAVKQRNAIIKFQNFEMAILTCRINLIL